MGSDLLTTLFDKCTWIEGGADEQLWLRARAPVLDDPQVGEGVALVHREALVQPEGGRLISVVWNGVVSYEICRIQEGKCLSTLCIIHSVVNYVLFYDMKYRLPIGLHSISPPASGRCEKFLTEHHD